MRSQDGMRDNKEGEDRKGQNNDRVENSLWGGTFISGRGDTFLSGNISSINVVKLG